MEYTNRPCRECGGSEFYSTDVSLMGNLTSLLPVSFTWSRDVHLRVFGKCGLMEWFVSPDTLEIQKKKFQRDS